MSAANAFHPQFVVDPRGERTSVLLPIAEYEALLDDLSDLAAVAERCGEAVSSHDEVIARLKADGLL